MKRTLARLLAVVALSSGIAGCFILTHDPALSRGGTTTTTGADLDAATRARNPDAGPRTVNPTAAELNDLSNDGR